jgi:hypothetical protein
MGEEGLGAALPMRHIEDKGVGTMTNTEIITAQQQQIDELFELIEEFKLVINWQKLEIKILESEKFVVNEN